MQKYIPILFLLLSLLLLQNKVYPQQYNFTNFTSESGLSNGQILAVCQDNEGLMWFGTNGSGITKYNGIVYEYITDKDGLADNLVYTIVKDQQGRMWVGTSNGITIIDGKKYKTYTVKDGLTHDRVFAIFFDSKGNAWLGTGKGISIFKDSSLIRYSISPELDSASVFNITEDSEHNMWLSTLGNGIFKYNEKKTVNYTAKNGLATDYAYSVMEYKKGVYWFLMVAGLYELNNEAIKLLNPINYKNVEAIHYYSFYKSDSVIWLSTNRGLIKITDKVQQYTQQNGLVNNDIWKIYNDRENNLWFASKQNGVSKLANQSLQMYSEYDRVNCIYQSKDSRYWVGGRNGLTLIDGIKTKHFDKKDWKVYTDVTAINEDKNGSIWIGTGYGVVKYNDGQFSRMEADSNQCNSCNYIHDIFIDENENILLSTKQGVATPVDKTIQPVEWYGVPKGFVYSINQDYAGNYWLATESGLYKWDGQKTIRYGEKEGFKAKQAFKIIQGIRRELWISTEAGIYKYDYDNNIFTQITEKEGLASDRVNSIAIDKQGTIWAGLSNGLDRIEMLGNDRYTIRHYGVEDGFMGESALFNSILIDNQNKIWFGAQKGLMVYQPEYDKRNTIEPITHITNVLLYGQSTNWEKDWKEYFDSLDNYNLPVNLNLPYERNYLVFNYAGVSLTAPTKVRYRYMLKGLDENWLAATSKTEAVYPSLPPGEYEFLVKATNGEGVWNKQPASFKFVISPPFWRTWWFYSIIAGIILSGIYSYIRIRRANIKILKQQVVIKQKNEALNSANFEIAAKNKNITDSINYAQRIQQSFLTSEKVLKNCLNEYFILYKPRDIVSGDFYWAFDLPDRVLVVCADSTGHGIPGAFMSLIGISLLNEISHSKKITEPSKILDELRRIIIFALNPEQVDEGGKDGMDLALISIFKTPVGKNKIKVIYAGGNNSIYVVSTNENNEKELTEHKADKQPVAYYSYMHPFNQTELLLKKGDIIYMGTDGYADQFGGEKGKKFMSKRLKEILLQNSVLPFEEQQQKLEKAFNDWKGTLEQVDDVTVFGIEL